MDARFYKYRFAWQLDSAFRLPQPIPYDHPPGSVIWVKLDCGVADQIANLAS